MNPLIRPTSLMSEREGIISCTLVFPHTVHFYSHRLDPLCCAVDWNQGCYKHGQNQDGSPNGGFPFSCDGGIFQAGDVNHIAKPDGGICTDDYCQGESVFLQTPGKTLSALLQWKCQNCMELNMTLFFLQSCEICFHRIRQDWRLFWENAVETNRTKQERALNESRTSKFIQKTILFAQHSFRCEKIKLNKACIQRSTNTLEIITVQSTETRKHC